MLDVIVYCASLYTYILSEHKLLPATEFRANLDFTNHKDQNLTNDTTTIRLRRWPDDSTHMSFFKHIYMAAQNLPKWASDAVRRWFLECRHSGLPGKAGQLSF